MSARWPYSKRTTYATFFILLAASVERTHTAGCSFSDGANYVAQWVVEGSRVHIQLEYYNFPPNVNAWTGIAFGEAMFSGLDAAVVKVINGRVRVSDEYVNGYGPSWPDQLQDIQVQEARLANGVLKVRFSRPIFATNLEDHTIDGCTTWQFITGLGRAHVTNVGKHTRHPVAQTVCINECHVSGSSSRV